MMGPDCQGQFHEVQISSIQVEQTDVPSVNAGQFCSLKLDLSRSAGDLKDVRKGIVLVDKKLNPRSFSGFECELHIIFPYSSRQVTIYYKPLVNIKNTRQCVEIEESPESICAGQVAQMRLRFMKRKEYLRVNDQIIVHDTFMTAVGYITALLD